MNRSLTAALAWVVLYAGTSAARPQVDIGDERALDAIRAANPAQYEKVIGILSLAGNVSCETLPQMLKVQFGARDVKCSGALILTSYPAKRRLAFELDDTVFAGNIVLTGRQATLRHAKPAPPPKP